MHTVTSTSSKALILAQAMFLLVSSYYIGTTDEDSAIIERVKSAEWQGNLSLPKKATKG